MTETEKRILEPGQKVPADKELLSRMYHDERMTEKAIAKYFGASRNAVHKAMNRLGIQRRSYRTRQRNGSAHQNWKGSKIGYVGGHHRVKRMRGAPTKCSECGQDDPTKVYHWANLTGEYDNPADYRRLCVSCHSNFDRSWEKRERDSRGRFKATS